MSRGKLHKHVYDPLSLFFKIFNYIVCHVLRVSRAFLPFDVKLDKIL